LAGEAVEAIRPVYERWAGGDFGVDRDLFDPEMVLVMRPEFPDAGVYVGLEGLAEYSRGFLEPWTRITIEAEEMIEAGDSVVVAVRQSGVGSSSGAATELSYFHVWTLRGGRVIRLESIRERPQALAAVGLS
jgi:ketosteroid isomerase-like protein